MKAVIIEHGQSLGDQAIDKAIRPLRYKRELRKISNFDDQTDATDNHRI
jgi:hypothetical protein